jgi:hypothetical protein
MAQDKFRRKQTTILNADVAGYSPIMQGTKRPPSRPSKLLNAEV